MRQWRGSKKISECSQLKPHLFQITGCLRQNAHMSFVEIVPYVFEAPFSFLDDDLEASGDIGWNNYYFPDVAYLVYSAENLRS